MRSLPSCHRRQCTAPTTSNVTALAMSSTVLMPSSQRTGAAPHSTVGSIAIAADAKAIDAVGNSNATRGDRATKREIAPSGREAAARQPANVASAKTGSRATHMFMGLPKMPGVVSPWPNIMKPTATHPSASRTGAARPSRIAYVAVTRATNRAHAAIALTT